MRLHIELDDATMARLDELAGPRGRSGFVRSAIEQAIRHELRWADLEETAGGIANTVHASDADPASWVRQQRQADNRTLRV